MAQAAFAETEAAIPPPPADTLPAPEPRVHGNKGRFTTKRYGTREEPAEDGQESFFEYLSGLTQTDWESHLLYVYQWDPIVDLTKGGKENKYRKLYSHAISEDGLKKELGSGTYNLRLNQLNQTTRKEKTIRQVMVNIFDPDYPPNLPPGGWLDDPRNKEWAWAKPLIEKKWAVAPAAPAGSAGVPEYMVAFMNEVRRELSHRTDIQPGAKDALMSSVVTILPALLQQQNTASDPSKIIEALVKAKDMLVPAAAAPVQNNEMMSFMLAQLTRLQESNDKLVQILLTQKHNEAKPADPLAMVDTVSNIFAKLQGFVQPSEPKHWAENVAETLGPKILDLTSQIVQVNAMAQRMNAQPGRNVPQARPAIPAQAQPVYPTAPPPQSANPPQEVPPQANQAQPPEGVEMDTMQRSMLTNIAALTQAALNLGLPGDQFAEQMCRKFGDIAYEKFTESVQQEQLIPVFKSIPEAWQFLAPYESELPSFIEMFYAFGEPEEVEDSKSISEPEPIPVDAGKANKPKKVKSI
jgi:hypothetical protein